MKTILLCGLVLLLSIPLQAMAASPGCELTVFWECDEGYISASFPCDWASVVHVPGIQGEVIVWGNGKLPVTKKDMFENCEGWRKGWTTAKIEVLP